jgi:hypothetical protein
MNKLLERLRELAAGSRHQNDATREIVRVIDDPEYGQFWRGDSPTVIIVASIASESKDQNPALRKIQDLATRSYLFNAVLGEGRITLDLPSGVDHNDFPEFTDAYFAAGKIQYAPGSWRDLSNKELEIIHEEFPELINTKINEWYHGA